MHRFEKARAARRKHQDAILRRANVVGCGVAFKVVGGETTDTPAVVVYVKRKLGREALGPDQVIPAYVDDVPTDVVEVGEVVALGNTGRYRPAPGGCSIGHYHITAGTLGVVAHFGNLRVILSNNHVLANSNNAQIGDPVYQPGPADGGNSQDAIASLAKFHEIDFSQQPGYCPSARAIAGGLNLAGRAIGARHYFETYYRTETTYNVVDCAIAIPDAEDYVSDEIIDIGEVHGTRGAEIGMGVLKSGRTTGLTTGEVTGLDTIIQVGYGGGRYAWFEDQIVASPRSAGGDSGSLLVDDNLRAVGLLFAGSSGVGAATFFNPIGEVLAALDVTL